MTDFEIVFLLNPDSMDNLPKSRWTGILQSDAWDDMFQYNTLFHLSLVDMKGVKHEIGETKIAQFNMGETIRSPKVPRKFSNFDGSFFSLGQDSSYYENLYKLGPEISMQVLLALKDAAADLDLFNKALSERVTEVSLLRSVSKTTVRGQYHRLIHGGALLSEYKFSYKHENLVSRSQEPMELLFEVKPESNPPTNIHVLIGRNGVGKTYLLNSIIRGVVADIIPSQPANELTINPTSSIKDSFANLVSVSFSAFDPFRAQPEHQSNNSIRSVYIGLNQGAGDNKKGNAPKSLEILEEEFVGSLKVCLKGARIPRWLRAVSILETDPVFQEANVSTLPKNMDSLREQSLRLFRRLSSGHKIVLLTITRLVETVEERTLVLLDEPEAHLHPPLLSAYIRALSDLLTDRNGVAIVATHSPVVLQEVPQKCVWKLNRVGTITIAERPESETFGENVGVLTREAFGLEVTHSGFHTMLRYAVAENVGFDAVNAHFNFELGTEARAIVQALIAAQGNDSRSDKCAS